MESRHGMAEGITHVNYSHDNYIWWRQIHDGSLTYVENHEWRTRSKRLPELVGLGHVLHEEWSADSERLDLITRADDLLAYVSAGVRTGWLRLHVAAPSADQKAVVGEFVDQIRSLFPETHADAEIPVIFWYREDDEVKSVQRMLGAPRWQEIRPNYPSGTRNGLDRLMDEFRPDSRGQLLLWHGAPGTGKTWSLRALAQAWKEWCWFEYITDPDTFFGSADYMMHVLLEGNDRRRAPGRSGQEDPWRLLILEDTGEMLAADAKIREGQKLSRLLNIVDGFIGQGLKLLILVTTNEALGTLHPAVSRAGRCAGLVEFMTFPPDEAQAWLAANGSSLSRDIGGASLADLYARSQGYDEPPQRRPVGIVPARD